MLMMLLANRREKDSPVALKDGIFAAVPKPSDRAINGEHRVRLDRVRHRVV